MLLAVPNKNILSPTESLNFCVPVIFNHEETVNPPDVAIVPDPEIPPVFVRICPEGTVKPPFAVIKPVEVIVPGILTVSAAVPSLI